MYVLKGPKISDIQNPRILKINQYVIIRIEKYSGWQINRVIQLLLLMIYKIT